MCLLDYLESSKLLLLWVTRQLQVCCPLQLLYMFCYKFLFHLGCCHCLVPLRLKAQKSINVLELHHQVLKFYSWQLISLFMKWRSVYVCYACGASVKNSKKFKNSCNTYTGNRYVVVLKPMHNIFRNKRLLFLVKSCME